MKKNKKRSLGNINFSFADVSAIVCVLPLVAQIETETPAQNLLNVANSNSAAEKLLNHKSALSANEIRVISIAISAALYIVSGNALEYGLDFDIDSEWKSEINKHFFALNRLNPIFQNLVDDLMNS